MTNKEKDLSQLIDEIIDKWNKDEDINVMIARADRSDIGDKSDEDWFNILESKLRQSLLKIANAN